MFLVSDLIQDRINRIREFLNDEDAAIAVLLAAAHFEWTVSRAIMGLGKSPIRKLRANQLSRTSGLAGYEGLWTKEVACNRKYIELKKVISNWEKFSNSFGLRHLLIHGRKSTTLNYAKPRVADILQAARDIQRYCENHGLNLNARIKKIK